jgi:hypothetical protein
MPSSQQGNRLKPPWGHGVSNGTLNCAPRLDNRSFPSEQLLYTNRADSTGSGKAATLWQEPVILSLGF